MAGNRSNPAVSCADHAAPEWPSMDSCSARGWALCAQQTSSIDLDGSIIVSDRIDLHYVPMPSVGTPTLGMIHCEPGADPVAVAMGIDAALTESDAKAMTRAPRLPWTELVTASGILRSSAMRRSRVRMTEGLRAPLWRITPSVSVLAPECACWSEPPLRPLRAGRSNLV